MYYSSFIELSPLFSCICPNMRKKENEMTFRSDQILSVREKHFSFFDAKNLIIVVLFVPISLEKICFVMLDNLNIEKDDNTNPVSFL